MLVFKNSKRPTCIYMPFVLTGYKTHVHGSGTHTLVAGSGSLLAFYESQDSLQSFSRRITVASEAEAECEKFPAEFFLEFMDMT